MSIRSSWPIAEAPRATLLDHEPGRCYMGYFRNLSLVVWAGGADGAAVLRVRKLSHHLIKAYPDGHSNITFVLGGVAPPTEDARQAFAYIFNGKASDLRCMAVILEGDGFWASALRSTVTSLRQASSSQFAVRLFNTPDAILDWFPAEHAERTGVVINGPDLKAVMRSWRNDIVERLLASTPKTK